MPWHRAVGAAGPSSGIAHWKVAVTLDLPSTLGHVGIDARTKSFCLIPILCDVYCFVMGTLYCSTSTWSAPHYHVLGTLSGLLGCYPADIMRPHSDTVIVFCAGFFGFSALTNWIHYWHLVGTAQPKLKSAGSKPTVSKSGTSILH
jgi:hypothetical protein